jgi:hypothetical protein
MTFSKAEGFQERQLVTVVKSFLIWTFVLTVCWLVVGFPLVFLILTIGSLFAISLQAILPMSAVFIVAGSILCANVLAILAASGLLTSKGIHPHQVSWLRWHSGHAAPRQKSVYAACPLTCDRPLS